MRFFPRLAFSSRLVNKSIVVKLGNIMARIEINEQVFAKNCISHATREPTQLNNYCAVSGVNQKKKSGKMQTNRNNLR